MRVIDPDTDQNLIYAEFTDIRTNYNFTQPIEFCELFDLDSDPHQLKNLCSTFPPAKIAALRQQLHELYGCQGVTCN